MPGLIDSNHDSKYQKLQEFLDKWTLDRVKQMSLEDYSNVGDKDTFCYWLEFEAENLGRIGGKPSNKFGIWMRKTEKQIISEDFLFDNHYAWYRKYGETAQEAFTTVRNHIASIIESSQSGNFKNIDKIDLDSLSRWKIAFIYSNFRLMPIYKNFVVRKIAKHFEYPNFEKARLSDLHQFIAQQKAKEDDFFVFAAKQYEIATKTYDRNYYVIGSKYKDDDGKDTVSIIDYMLKRNVVATGFFWDEDFSELYNHSFYEIHKWIDDNVKDKSGKYQAGKRTLGYFLNLKPGDIIAVKSHGLFGSLTIIAYAEVKEVEGKVYEPDGNIYPEGLGHIVHVEFIESNLWIDTGLTYGQTIHHIVPGENEGHFEKIFGSYSTLEKDPINIDLVDDMQDDVDISVEEDRINEKLTEPRYRKASYTSLVSQTHNKIQIAFAKQLKLQFPSDIIRTESNYIDIKRENENEIFYYEVKPYNSAYSCIRAGIGQLLDYCYSNTAKSKKIHLRVVGTPQPLENDLKFITFIKHSLNISFDYIDFQIEK
jgi:hypothetical protein